MSRLCSGRPSGAFDPLCFERKPKTSLGSSCSASPARRDTAAVSRFTLQNSSLGSGKRRTVSDDGSILHGPAKQKTPASFRRACRLSQNDHTELERLNATADTSCRIHVTRYPAMCETVHRSCVQTRQCFSL